MYWRALVVLCVCCVVYLLCFLFFYYATQLFSLIIISFALKNTFGKLRSCWFFFKQHFASSFVIIMHANHFTVNEKLHGIFPEFISHTTGPFKMSVKAKRWLKKDDFMHSTLNLAVDEINIHECIMHRLDLVVVQHDVLSEHLICISVKMQMFA